LITWLN